MESIAKRYDDHYTNIRFLLNYLELAQAEQLDVEFMDTFLQDYETTKNITASAWHAAREWDL